MQSSLWKRKIDQLKTLSFKFIQKSNKKTKHPVTFVIRNYLAVAKAAS